MPTLASMQGGSDGPPATSAAVHCEAAHGGAAGKAMKPASPMKEIVTNRAANRRQACRSRSHSTPATAHGARK